MSLICDVFDILLKEKNGNLIASTTLQSADLDIKVDSKEVRGGKGDALIALLHSARNVDLKVADIAFRYDWLANQLGQTITKGAITTWATPKWYEAVDLDGSEAGTVIGFTLDETPLTTNSGLKIFDSTGKEVVLTTGYTITGKAVTIVTGVAGSKYEVRGYQYTTVATAETITIDNTSFAQGVTCILETLEINEDETPLARVQIILDEVLPSGNVSISTKSAKDANVQNFEFKAIKPKTATAIGRIVRIPIV